MINELQPYPSYKSSGVEWLGDVPAHWEVRRLKYLATLIMGQSPSSEDCSDIPIGPPFLQGCAEFGIHHPTPVQYCRAPSKISPLGAILMSVRAPVGRLNISNQEYGIGRGLCAIVSNIEVLHAGLAQYQLEVLGQGLNMVATGSTYEAVSVGDVGNHLCIVPPLPEQTAIVRYLDQADERIRRYISSRERLIGLLEEYRQAIIHHAVTRGLDPDVRLKPSGVEWLGDVPAHWKVRRLRSLAKITTGGQDTINRREDGKYPFFVRSQTVERINTWSFDDEAVLTAGDGVGVGKVFHYVNGKFDYHQRVYKFSDFYAISGKFFFHYFRALLRFEVLQGTAKTTVDSLRLPMLQNFPVALPPHPEQAAIVAYLDKATADIDAAIDRARREIELLSEYRTRLIADVITGKVDVREAVADLPQ